MTFEQIYDSAYYRDFGIANLATDEIIEDGVVTHDKKETTDASGRTYIIREFALPPNPATRMLGRPKGGT